MFLSKITIDHDEAMGAQIRIDYRFSDDLRDRMVGRFLQKMGIPSDRRGFWAYCRLGHETTDGCVVMIEPMDERVFSLHQPGMEDVLRQYNGKMPEQKPDTDPIVAAELKRADDWAVANMPHELYKKWHAAIFGIVPRSKDNVPTSEG
jgi:hypothetical protein